MADEKKTELEEPQEEPCSRDGGGSIPVVLDPPPPPSQ
jgi:hypothetical protein